LIEKILRTLLDHVIEKYHKWLLERKAMPNEIAVYELCSCRQKSIFNRSLPELILSESLRPGSIIGELIHEGLEKIFGYEEKVFKKSIDIEGVKYTLCGQPDYFDGEVLIDFKYTTAPEHTLPKEHHLLQVKLYKWITEAKEAYILYITPRGLFTIKVEECLADDDVRRLFETWSSPRFPWECAQCLYRSHCPHAKAHKEAETRK